MIQISADDRDLQLFKKLQQRHRLMSAIECGTGTGTTTRQLAQTFADVQTIELDSVRYLKAGSFQHAPNVQRYCGSARVVLPELLHHCAGNALVVLHQNDRMHLTLTEQIKIIADSNLNPVILINLPREFIQEQQTWAATLEHLPGKIAQALEGLAGEGVTFRGRRVPFGDAALHRAILIEPSSIHQPSQDGYTLLSSFSDFPPERLEEHLSCLKENLDLPLIQQVVLFQERPWTQTISSSKLKIQTVTGRPCFQTMFNYANEQLRGRRCIVANADIAFDTTLGKLDDNDLVGQLVNLTRWDEQADGDLVHLDNPFSQDAWIFRSPIPIRDAWFYCGVPGCDNLITWLATEAGLTTNNPSRQIIIRHRHQSQIRQVSNSTDRIVGHRQPTMVATKIV